MTNTFLIMTDSNRRTIRIRADAISAYSGEGLFSTVNVEGVNIDVLHTVEAIDKALAETYFMMKPVENE